MKVLKTILPTIIILFSPATDAQQREQLMGFLGFGSPLAVTVSYEAFNAPQNDPVIAGLLVNEGLISVTKLNQPPWIRVMVSREAAGSSNLSFDNNRRVVTVVLGKRVFEKQTYANTWNTMGHEFQSYRFNYAIEPVWPSLPKLVGLDGLVVARRDPASGDWQFVREQSRLQDMGTNPYALQIENRKAEGAAKISAIMASSLNEAKELAASSVTGRFKPVTDGVIKDDTTGLKWSLKWNEAYKIGDAVGGSDGKIL